MTKLAKNKGFETLSCLWSARDRVNVVGTNNDKVFQTTPRHSHSAHIHNLFHILLLAKSQQFPTFSPFMTVKRPVFGSCCFQNTYSTFFVFKKSDSVFSFSLETKNNWLNVFFFTLAMFSFVGPVNTAPEPQSLRELLEQNTTASSLNFMCLGDSLRKIHAKEKQTFMLIGQGRKFKEKMLLHRVNY